MKKLIAFFLCVILTFALSACSSGKDKDTADSSKPTDPSVPAIGFEIGSEEYNESSEDTSSEEETTFDPNGVYDTGKDPFLNDDQVSEYTVKNGFEEDSAYIISSGLDKYTADKAKIHGGNVSLCARADTPADPCFYFSVPEMTAGAECEITLFVLTESAVSGSVEFSSLDLSTAEASASLEGLTPGKWSSITATFFASSADVYVKAPSGATIYFDDITFTYKQ